MKIGTFEHRPETGEANTGKPRPHRSSSFAIFQKKRKINFKKAESGEKKKRNSAEKSKIDIPAT